MSIGKRFVRLVRSNFNTLLERSEDGPSGRKLEDLSDAELEAELNRRRTRRESAQRANAEGARGGNADEEAWQEVEDTLRGSRYRTTGGARRASRSYERVNRARPAAGDQHLAKLYAQLECPFGADMNTVRKQYRALMRKYHPDMHSGDAEKQRLATELSQQLTAAYNELRRKLT